tara:strand:+ start:240 stop:620 length:381 start_codon:yes stop_codon:yes gene_type:complete
VEKNYSPQIIANDLEGLRMVSACVAGAKIKISDIKFLKLNKIFLLSGERNKVETTNKKVNFVCKFEFIQKVKSKNIDQKNQEVTLELIAIEYLKNKDDYEINLNLSNNAHIALTTESLEISLEDQI